MQIRGSVRSCIAAARSVSRRQLALAEASYLFGRPTTALRTFATQTKDNVDETAKHVGDEAAPNATHESQTEQIGKEAQSSKPYFSFFGKKQVDEVDGPSFASESPQGAKEEPKVETPKKLPPFYSLREDIKDVLAIVFGMERKRDVEFEYDMGLRPYPWVTYVEVATGERVYRNVETGVITNSMPAGFEKRAKPEAYLDANLEQHALTIMQMEKGVFGKIKERVVENPVAATVIAAGSAIKESPIGEAASRVKAKVSDVREDLQETWETSQHP